MEIYVNKTNKKTLFKKVDENKRRAKNEQKTRNI